MLVDAQSADHLKVLTELLHSSNDAARAQGEVLLTSQPHFKPSLRLTARFFPFFFFFLFFQTWLIALLRAQLEGKKIANVAAVESLCGSLAHSPSHILRHTYLSITDKLILMHKAKVPEVALRESRSALPFCWKYLSVIFSLSRFRPLETSIASVPSSKF